LSGSAKERLHPVTYTLWFLLAAYGLALCGVGPSLVAIARDYRVPVGRTGVLFTGLFVGFTGAVLAAGYLAERLGKKIVLLLGLLALAGGLLAFGLVPILGAFSLAVGAAFLIGIGGAMTESVSSALLADLNPTRAAYVLNISQGFFGVGAVLGPNFVGWLLSRGITWRVHFGLAAGLAAALFLVLWAQRVPAEERRPVDWAALRRLIARPTLLLGIVGMACYIGAEAGYSAWLSPFLQHELGASARLAAQAVGLYWLGMTIARFFSAWAAESLGPELLVVILALTTALTVVATSVATTVAAGLVLAAACGAAMSGIFASILTSGSDHHPGQTAPVFSLIMASIGVGGMSFPAGMGAIGDAVGLRWAMLLPAVLSLGLAAAMLRLRALRPAGRPAVTGE